MTFTHLGLTLRSKPVWWLSGFHIHAHEPGRSLQVPVPGSTHPTRPQCLTTAGRAVTAPLNKYPRSFLSLHLSG